MTHHYLRKISIFALITSFLVVPIFMNATLDINKIQLETSNIHHGSSLSTKLVSGTRPPISGNWVINSVTTVENETLIVNGNIEITTGGALILNNSRLFINSTENSIYTFRVSGGNLTVLNSEIKALQPEWGYELLADSNAFITIKFSELGYMSSFRLFSVYLTIENSVLHNIERTDFSLMNKFYLYNISYLNSGSIDLSDCNGASIVNSTLNNSLGIRIINSNNVTIANNTILRVSTEPIYVNTGSNLYIKNNFISSLKGSIALYDVTNLTITGNEIEYASILIHGSFSQFATYTIDYSNTLNGKTIRYYYNTSNYYIGGLTWGEVILAYCSQFYLENMQLSSVLIVGSNDTKIVGGTISNSSFGVYLYSTNNINVTGVNIYNTTSGIICYNAKNTLIEDNLMNSSVHGDALSAYYSDNLLLNNNVMSGYKWGINLQSSTNVTMINNKMFNMSIVLVGLDPTYKTTVISSNNTINGYPIIYYYNQTNITINGGNFGQLIFVYCSDIYIERITAAALFLYSCNRVEITKSLIENGSIGIYLTGVSNASILINEITGQMTGIRVYPSMYNISIINNYIHDNALHGILSLGLVNTTIKRNVIKGNGVGILFSTMTNCSVYLNDFITNAFNAYTYAGNANLNVTGLGNYWSDYSGLDKNKDGIGDTPYYFDINSADYYPLISPVNYIQKQLIKTIKQEPYIVTEVDEVKIELETDPIVTNAILSYYNGESWVNVTMVYIGNDTYSANIPSMPVGSKIIYKIYVRDVYNLWRISPSYSYTVSASDTQGPNIVKIEQSPVTPTDKDEVKIKVSVSDQNDIKIVILSYSTGENWSNITMGYNSTTGFYEAVIPAHSYGTQVRYKIYVEDIYNNTSISPIVTYLVVKSDVEAPVILEVKRIPQTPTDEDQVTILAKVMDDSGVSNVVLSYSNGEAWVNVTMVYNASSGYYEAVIPAFSIGTEVKYKVYAVDLYGNWSMSPILSYVVVEKELPSGGINEGLLYLALGGFGVIILAFGAIYLIRRR